jgi:putative alpha-1,2-mannosidase
LDINFYGNVHDDGARWRRQYFTSNDIQTVVDAFGDKVRISEFNIDSDNTKLESLSRDEQVRYTRQLYTDIRKLGVSAAYMYQYRGYRDQDNQFAVRLTTGDTKPYWDVLSTDNNRRSLI